MEVIRIYSEVDTNERLYSVLMDEEELYLFSEVQREFTSKATKELRRKFQDREGARTLAKQSGYETMKWGAGSHGQTEFEYFDKSGKKITGTGEFGNFGDRSRNIRAYRDSQRASAQNLHGDVLAQRQKAIQEGATADLKNKMRSGLSDKSKKILEERRKQRQAQSAPKPLITPSASATPKPPITSPSAAVPKASGSVVSKAFKFIGRHKVGLGIGAGVAATAGVGAYLYNKKKETNYYNHPFPHKLWKRGGGDTEL